MNPGAQTEHIPDSRLGPAGGAFQSRGSSVAASNRATCRGEGSPELHLDPAPRV